MKDNLQRICDLQPLYSRHNTELMQERGELIRNALRQDIEGMESLISPNLGSFGADFAVDGSDGKGNKVATPWVRFGSRAMSPTPKHGYYVVIHFKTDGTGLYLTIGCASTRWDGRDWTPRKPDDLRLRTNRARRLLMEKHGGLGSFTDDIVLGGKTPLSKSFEQATVMSKLIPCSSLQDANLDGLLVELSGYLKTIYDAQASGFDISPAEQDQAETETIIKPLRRKPGAQGYNQSAEDRKSIEMRAMHVTDEWLKSKGYTTQDTSVTESYDILASKDGENIYVEVKGTTSYEPSSIIMTSNEVELHREKKGQTALAIVSSIELKRGTEPKAFGGELEIEIGWDIDTWALNPSQYRLQRQR